MGNGWKAGLDDLEDQGLGPSAANPLAALGIDPDQVRANPDLLASLSAPGATKSNSAPADASPASAPAPTPAASSVQPTESTPYSMAMSGLKNLDKTQGMANAAAEEVPTTDPNITKLQAQRDKLAAPVDLYDSATGKMKKQAQVYNPQTGQMESINAAPSAGRRIWRGVRGGLVGLLTGGIQGAALGALDPSLLGQDRYGAPTEALQRAEERNSQALDATDTGIKNEFSTWKNMVDAAKAKSTELRTNATIGKDQSEGGSNLIKSQAELQRAQNEDPLNKNKAALQLSADQLAARTKQVAGMKLSPLNRTLFILNGKVPDPREPNAAEIDAAAAARALTVFRAQHGGKDPQTLEDFNAIQAAARGTLHGPGGGPTDPQITAIQEKKNAAIQRANEDFAKNPYGDAARQNYQKQLQLIQNDFEEKAAQYGVGGEHMNVTVDEKGQAQWSPAPAAAAPATAAAPTVEAPPGATAEVLDGQGKLAGHVVDGKFVKLRK